MIPKQIHSLKNIIAVDEAPALVDNWMTIFQILETLLSDGGRQYRRILLESVYDYLDINGLKTTPFH